MRQFGLISAVILVFALPPVFGQAGFASGPVLSASGGRLTVIFSVTASTDVEVAVLDASGNIVRHLAAGLLGGAKTPPPPLAAGLSQAIAWDYKDDYGNTAAGGPFNVRIRLGLKLTLDHIINTRNVPGTDFSGSYTPPKPYVTGAHPFLPLVWDKPNGGHTPPFLDFAINDVTYEMAIKTYHDVNLYRYNALTGNSVGTITLTTGQQAERQQWGEPAYSWDGRTLYYSSAMEHVTKLTLAGAVFPWSALGSHIIGGFPMGFQHSRGHAAGPNGNLYVLHYTVFRGGLDTGPNLVGAVSEVDPAGNVLRKEFLKTPNMAYVSGGIKVDKDNNVFIGARIKPTLIPPLVQQKLAAAGEPMDLLTTGWWAMQMYGSLVKYDNTGKMQWLYYGMSPQFTHATYPNGPACCCKVSRFDVDRFGRVFLPDVFQYSIVVLDNSGNEIKRVGSEALSGAVFAWPDRVEVTDYGVFIGDQVNSLIACLRFGGLTEQTLSEAGADIETPAAGAPWPVLVNSPNPFRNGTAIRYTVPSRQKVILSVHNARGLLVASLVDGSHGPCTRTVRWDCRDFSGRQMPSGVYFCRLRLGSGVLERKMVLVR